MTTAHTQQFNVATRGKGTYEITQDIARIVRESGVKTGIATVFIQHTSASLIIYENADRSARSDLESFFDRLVPEDADYFSHTAEGPDDMPSHLRMVLTRTSESVPIVRGARARHLAGDFSFRAPARAAFAENCGRSHRAVKSHPRDRSLERSERISFRL